MAFNPEIKNFIKNTLIFTVIFSLVIHFSWEYIATSLGFGAQAHNDFHFENANVIYVGNTATALSLRLGGISQSQGKYTRGDVIENISISEVLGSPQIGQEKLIASNMIAITAYANAVSTDVLQLLNESSNREKALDNYISLLKSYYIKTQDRLSLIQDQKNDLNVILQQTNKEQQLAKTTLQSSYKNFEYSGVDGAISQFLQAKNVNSRAKIYMIYLERFQKSYIALQNKTKTILNILLVNKEGIINKSVVIIPDKGVNIIKELGLIKSEADYKAQQALQ